MTIIKAMQNWLEEFDGGIELSPLDEILTDRTDEAPRSFALAPAGSDKASQDVVGERTYRYNYVLYVKAHGGNEVDREGNYALLEAIADWIEEHNDDRDFPKFPGGRIVEEVTAANAMLFDLFENGFALYQVQIQLTFTKEGKRPWQ